MKLKLLSELVFSGVSYMLLPELGFHSVFSKIGVVHIKFLDILILINFKGLIK